MVEFRPTALDVDASATHRFPDLYDTEYFPEILSFMSEESCYALSEQGARLPSIELDIVCLLAIESETQKEILEKPNALFLHTPWRMD